MMHQPKKAQKGLFSKKPSSRVSCFQLSTHSTNINNSIIQHQPIDSNMSTHDHLKFLNHGEKSSTLTASASTLGGIDVPVLQGCDDVKSFDVNRSQHQKHVDVVDFFEEFILRCQGVQQIVCVSYCCTNDCCYSVAWRIYVETCTSLWTEKTKMFLI